MNIHATVSLVPDGLAIRCDALEFNENRPLDLGHAVLVWRWWAKRCTAITNAGEQVAPRLRDLGHQMMHWLDGDSGLIVRLLGSAAQTLLLEFIISKTDSSFAARAFLDAPWGLLAQTGGLWGLDSGKVFRTLRRIRDADAEQQAATFIAHACCLVDQHRAGEALVCFERAMELLPPGRDRALVSNAVGRIKRERGQLGVAFQLQQECLSTSEQFGDPEGVATACWEIAHTELRRRNLEAALDMLERSFGIYLQLRSLRGIGIVGSYLGEFLCAMGSPGRGVPILKRSRDAFLELGLEDEVRRVQALLDGAPEPPPVAPSEPRFPL